MSGEIVDLTNVRLKAGRHKQGRVKCGACQHEWVAVCSSDTPEPLECPSCRYMRGMWNCIFDIEEGDASYRCSTCGHDSWILGIKKSGHEYIVCKSCGNTTSAPISFVSEEVREH